MDKDLETIKNMLAHIISVQIPAFKEMGYKDTIKYFEPEEIEDKTFKTLRRNIKEQLSKGKPPRKQPKDTSVWKKKTLNRLFK